MKRSNIGWADYSGGDCNFVTGCTAVSPGCEHCYARAIYERFGRNFDEVTVHPEKLERLAKTQFGTDNKRGHGSRPVVFVCDTGDLFHPDVPSDFVLQSFEVMGLRQDVDWVVLTKRPQIMRETLRLPHFCGCSPLNIWMGVTVENQAMAEQRLPILLGAWGRKAFVSVEPMLGPVDFTAVEWDGRTTMNVLEGAGVTTKGGMMGQSIPNCYCKGLDWVIVGAESGPHRREFQVQWANDLWEQCLGAGVPMFAKQDSGLYPGVPLLLDGKHEVKEWPR